MLLDTGCKLQIGKGILVLGHLINDAFESYSICRKKNFHSYVYLLIL